MNRKALLLFAATSVIWGSSCLFIWVAVAHLPPSVVVVVFGRNVTDGSARAGACAADVLRCEGVGVSATKKAKDKAQAAKGKAKKGTGKALADPVLEGKGKAEEAKGNLKQAGEKVKDAAKK